MAKERIKTREAIVSNDSKKLFNLYSFINAEAHAC
jgi:hypothetical protein